MSISILHGMHLKQQINNDDQNSYVINHTSFCISPWLPLYFSQWRDAVTRPAPDLISNHNHSAFFIFFTTLDLMNALV